MTNVPRNVLKPPPQNRENNDCEDRLNTIFTQELSKFIYETEPRLNVSL